MINRYIQLINNALRNEDNTIRSRAQFQLIELRDKDTISFFDICSELLGGQQFDQFLRQSAATLLSRSATLKYGDDFCWDRLPTNIKEKVKEKALNTLIHPNMLIMKSGADVISSIAFVEIPRNQWLEIIDILAENTTNNNIAIKNASIVTIGLICQQFNFGNKTVNSRVCEQLLGGIIVGARSKQSSQIVETSLIALRNSINFLGEILKDQAVRNQVFSILLNFVKTEDVIQTVYQGFFQFSKSCYDNLGDYIQKMTEFIIQNLRERNDNTILALELIDTIGSQYIEKTDDQIDRYNQGVVNNYLQPITQILLPEVMRCFLIENKDDLSFSEMRISANKTLGTMIACGNRQAVDIVVNGVAAILKSENVGHQQASAIILSSLCQYSSADQQYAQKYINDAFQPVIGLLSSPEPIVVTNTLSGFTTIAQHYSHYFYTRTHSLQIFDKLFQLQKSNNATIKTSVLKIFNNITDNFKSSDNLLLKKPQIFLTKIVNEYDFLLDNYVGENIDYCERISYIIVNCLVKLDDRQIITHMIEFLLGKYYYFNAENPNNNRRHYSRNQLEMISLSILSLVNTVVLAMEKFLPQEQIMHNLSNVVDLHLNKFGIDGQVIDVISSMAVAFKQLFERKAEQYWPHILHALDIIDNQKCFACALRCVGDYSRVYSQNFSDKINEIMKRLLRLIHQNIERNIKLNIISCIGDMLLGLGMLAEPYVEEILNICQLCFTAVYQLSSQPTQKQYVEQLKLVLIEMYACLVFALIGTSRYHHHPNQKLVAHFQTLVIFIIKTCAKSQNPTVNYLKNALFLLFDEIAFFWESKQNRGILERAMNSIEIKQLVQVVKNFTDREDIRQLCKHIEQRYIYMNS